MNNADKLQDFIKRNTREGFAGNVVRVANGHDAFVLFYDDGTFRYLTGYVGGIICNEPLNVDDAAKLGVFDGVRRLYHDYKRDQLQLQLDIKFNDAIDQFESIAESIGTFKLKKIVNAFLEDEARLDEKDLETHFDCNRDLS